MGVDWSGRRGPDQRRHIWWGEAVDGVLVALDAGRSREEVVERLCADPPVVAALDLSFAPPAWWLDAAGLASAAELWRAAAELAPADDPPWPFWGHPGRRRRPRPAGGWEWRSCEQALRARGLRPSSTFQVAGAGTVGAGSLRGWPLLPRLVEAGFAVWPFAEPIAGQPVLVEGWPRLSAPTLRKHDPGARAGLAASLPVADPSLRERAAASDDALDAAVLAVGLGLPPPASGLPAVAHREGWCSGVGPGAG